MQQKKYDDSPGGFKKELDSQNTQCFPLELFFFFFFNYVSCASSLYATP